MTIRPNLRGFFQALIGDWFSLMSGTIGVCASIYATFASNPNQRQAFWAAAATCILLASFRIWSKERTKYVELLGDTPEYRPQHWWEWVVQPEFIPLPLACRKFYADIRKTSLDNFLRFIAGEVSMDEEHLKMLNAIASQIAHAVPVWGVVPPSNRLELLDENLLKSCWFTGGGAKFTRRGEVKLDALCVKTRDLEKALSHVRQLMPQTFGNDQ